MVSFDVVIIVVVVFVVTDEDNGNGVMVVVVDEDDVLDGVDFVDFGIIVVVVSTDVPFSVWYTFVV